MTLIFLDASGDDLDSILQSIVIISTKLCMYNFIDYMQDYAIVNFTILKSLIFLHHIW